MPITQERMLAVVSEAENILAAFTMMRQNVLDFVAAALKDDGYDKATMAQVIKLTALNVPVPHHHAIYAERRHFTSHAKRNERERRRQRHTRLQHALTPHTERATPRSTTPRPAPNAADEWAIDDATATDLNSVFDQGANAANATGELTLDSDAPDAATLAADKDFEATLAREELSRGKDARYVAPNVNLAPDSDTNGQ